MKFIVDGSHPMIQSRVSSRSKSQSLKEITFSNLTIKARDEGVVYRARTKNIRAVCTNKAGNFREVQVVEAQPARTSGHFASDEGNGQLFYDAKDSTGTSYLPPTINESQEHLNEDEEETKLLYAIV